MQGEGGIHPVSEEFFQAARELCDSTGALLLADVGAAFEAVAAARGPGSRQRKRQALGGLFARATPEERDLLERIIHGGGSAPNGRPKILKDRFAPVVNQPLEHLARSHIMFMTAKSRLRKPQKLNTVRMSENHCKTVSGRGEGPRGRLGSEF